MKRCKHTSTETQWHLDAVRSHDEPRARYIELLRCVDCGELMGMRPSNDKPVAVRIEIRAAAIAARKTPPSRRGYELEGWIHRGLWVYWWSRRASWNAGWLAHAIVHHDSENELQQAELDRQAQACADDRLRNVDPLYRHTRCTNGGCLFSDRCQSPLSCEGRR